MKGMAKLTNRDGCLLLTPRMVADGAWRDAYGRPVEDSIRMVAHALAYLLLKYPVVPHWLFRETVTEMIRDVVEVDGEYQEVPISDGKAVQLIEEALKIGIFETARPEGARQNLIYFFTEDQKNKLLRIQRLEALGHASALEQAKHPENPEAGLTEQNKSWYRNALSLIHRHDDEWRDTMAKLRKLLHVVGLFLLLTAGGLITTMIVLTSFSTMAEADFSSVKKGQ